MIAIANKRENFYYVLALVGQVGYALVIPLLVFIGFGVFLDKQFNTKPFFIFLGLGIGISASLYSLYKLIKPFLKVKK